MIDLSDSKNYEVISQSAANYCFRWAIFSIKIVNLLWFCLPGCPQLFLGGVAFLIRSASWQDSFVCSYSIALTQEEMQCWKSMCTAIKCDILHIHRLGNQGWRQVPYIHIMQHMCTVATCQSLQIICYFLHNLFPCNNFVQLKRSLRS